MRQVLLLTFLATCLSMFGQEDPFERVYSLPNATNLVGTAVDRDGYYLFAIQNADKNIQVTRVAPDGTHEWTNVYPYFVDMGLYSHCIDAGPECIMVAGFALGNGTFSRDGVLLRIGFDGTLLSSTRVDVDGSSNAFHTLKATSNGFVCGGRASVHGYDMQLTKLNDQGEVQWAKTFGTPDWDWAYDVTELADGGYAMIGYGDALGTGFSPSAYLVRTDALGNELWARSITSGNSVDEGYNVTEAPDGSLYIGGRTLGYILGSVNAWITKLTPTGDHVWTRVLEKGVETASLIAAQDGGVWWMVHPQWVVTIPGGYEMAWGKLDADGNVVASKVYGAAGNDYGIGMVAKPDGSLAILGTTNSYSGNYQQWQALLVQTDLEGNAVCDPLDSTLVWRDDFSATVAPFTSLTSSGFMEYPWPLGTTPVAVDTYDPCCAVRPDFNIYPLGSNEFAWGFANTTTGGASYLWTFGDGTTSTEASPTHTYASSGTYIVCLTATGSCGEGTTCKIISITVGIDEIQAAGEKPFLFPSPADQSFVVTATRPIGTIQLIDQGGRTVKTINGGNRTDLDVPTADLPTGLYAVRVFMQNGDLHHLRTMIIH